MSAPQNIQPNPGIVGDGVASFDASGNLTLTGNLLMPDGVLELGNVANAPGAIPATLQLYTGDGVTLNMVAAGGQAAGLTIPGVLTVNGSQTLSGVLAVTGSQGTSGVLQITDLIDNASDGVVHIENFDATSRTIGVRVTGEAQQRFVMFATGQQQFGPGGNGSRDTNLGRAAAGVLYTDKNLLVGSATALGDNGVGEIQLADIATPATTNPTAGILISSTSGTSTPMKVRDPAGNVRSVVDGFFRLTTNPTFTLAAQTATPVTLTVESSAVYLVTCGLIILNTTGSTTPSWTGPAGATMQWNDTTTSGDYSSTIGATNNPFPSLATPRMIFLHGILITAGTPGSLTLTVGVSAGTTTVESGTWLQLTRMS